MAKTKKKRTKRYTGTDAAQGPVVRHYEAVERTAVGQWWFDHKKRIRTIATIVLVLLVIAFIISGIVTLIR